MKNFAKLRKLTERWVDLAEQLSILRLEKQKCLNINGHGRMNSILLRGVGEEAKKEGRIHATL